MSEDVRSLTDERARRLEERIDATTRRIDATTKKVERIDAKLDQVELLLYGPARPQLELVKGE